MAKEPHWKCGKAQAPRVRVPCPLPETKRTSDKLVFFVSGIRTVRDSNPKGRERWRDSPVGCRVASGSSGLNEAAQTGRSSKTRCVSPVPSARNEKDEHALVFFCYKVESDIIIRTDSELCVKYFFGLILRNLKNEPKKSAIIHLFLENTVN